MKRFLKILALLIIGLFVLASGLDATLDHLSRGTGKSSFTVYNEKGVATTVYKGNLNNCVAYTKPGVPHRSGTTTVAPETEYRWF